MREIEHRTRGIECAKTAQLQDWSQSKKDLISIAKMQRDFANSFKTGTRRSRHRTRSQSSSRKESANRPQPCRSSTSESTKPRRTKRTYRSQMRTSHSSMKSRPTMSPKLLKTSKTCSRTSAATWIWVDTSATFAICLAVANSIVRVTATVHWTIKLDYSKSIRWSYLRYHGW